MGALPEIYNVTKIKYAISIMRLLLILICQLGMGILINESKLLLSSAKAQTQARLSWLYSQLSIVGILSKS